MDGVSEFVGKGGAEGSFAEIASQAYGSGIVKVVAFLARLVFGQAHADRTCKVEQASRCNRQGRPPPLRLSCRQQHIGQSGHPRPGRRQ